MKFSMIIVSLNAGEKLKNTVDSVLMQTCKDFEIIIKDAGSTDGSLDFLTGLSDRIVLLRQPDKGIYDGMNQAVLRASGEYFLFLNSGDYLYDETVLENVNRALSEHPGTDLLYGNYFNRDLNTEIYSYREITPFTCYRNVPNHQTCFYSRKLFAQRAYDLQFEVRADYEHFLYCYFEKKAKMYYLESRICSYEGAGFSETREHLKLSKKEHKIITKKYLSFWQRFRFRLILVLTLQPLRTFMANNKRLSVLYNGLKNSVYGK